MDFHLIGPPLEEIFEAVAPSVSPEFRAELVLAYRALYRVDDYARSRVFSGIPGLLRSLREQGVPAFVATNKRKGDAASSGAQGTAAAVYRRGQP